MRRLAWLSAAVGVFACSLAATTAHSQVFFDFEQNGNNVVATASGAFNTSLAKSYEVSGGFGGYIIPDVAFFGIGNQGAVRDYVLTDAPSAFGTTHPIEYYSSTSGTSIGMNGGVGILFISSSYVSGSAISSTALFPNTSLAALNLTSGEYDFRAGGNAIRLTIGQAVSAAPEPATWAMMIAGFGLAGYALRRRAGALMQPAGAGSR